MTNIESLKNQNSSPGEKNMNKLEEGNQSDKNQKGEIYSVDDAVNKIGYGKFQIILLIMAGLGWCADACEIFILSIIGDYIACDWVLYRWGNALLTSVVFIGIALGCPVFGVLADVYGRKTSLSVSMIVLFVFGTVTALSPSFVWMVIFRACMGFAVGGISQGLTLCSEFCPVNMRGKYGFYLCYFWSVGTIGVILLSWVVMLFIGNWRLLLILAALPAFVVVLCFKWYPESPRFYLVSHQYDKAVAILQRAAKTNKTELPAGRLMSSLPTEKRGRFKDLLSKEYRITSLLFWYIWFASAFSYYGVALISPQLIAHGSLTMDSNSTDMQRIMPCTKLTQQNFIDLLWTSSAEFPGLFIFSFLVEMVNRKILMSTSFFISGVCILLLLLRTVKIVLLLDLFVARGIIVSIFQLAFIMTSETYPTTMRAVGMGYGSFFCRIGGLIVPYVSQVLVVVSPTATIILLAMVVFLAGVAAICLPFETRGAGMKETLTETGAMWCHTTQK